MLPTSSWQSDIRDHRAMIGCQASQESITDLTVNDLNVAAGKDMIHAGYRIAAAPCAFVLFSM